MSINRKGETVRLTSPRGVVVSVREDKAAALVGIGFTPIKPKRSTSRKKKVIADDPTGNSDGRGDATGPVSDDGGVDEG